MRFYAAAETDIGVVKQQNEDSICFLLADTPAGQAALAVVCDGMGGLQHGEVASATVVTMFADWFENTFPKLLPNFRWEIVREQWDRLIRIADDRLREYGAQNRMRLGTTVSAILFFEHHYLIGHAGDSRIYEIDSSLVQLTEDQSLVAREVRRGTMTLDQAEHDPRRNVLLECVGASGGVHPMLITGTIRPNACYLLCSDGLHHELSLGELYAAVNPAASFSKAAMHDNLRGIIRLVIQRGEEDNISALLVRTAN